MQEQIRDGGTRVRVWLNKDPQTEEGLFDTQPRDIKNLGTLCAWLAPALDVDLYVEDEKKLRRVVAASDWLTMDGVTLFKRILSEESSWHNEVYTLAPLISELQDSQGRIVGRAVVSNLHRRNTGVVTVGGLRTGYLAGAAGIFIGSTAKLARDSAFPLAQDSAIANWATKQAKAIAGYIKFPFLRLICGSSVAAHGGDPGKLPVAKRGNSFLTLRKLHQWKNAPPRIVIVSALSFTDYKSINFHPHVLAVQPSGCTGSP